MGIGSLKTSDKLVCVVFVVLVGFIYLVSAISSLTSVTLNATSTSNLTSGNLTATISGLAPLDSSIQYDWYNNGSLSAVFLGNSTYLNTIPYWFTAVGDEWYINATSKNLTDNYDVSIGVYSNNMSVIDLTPAGMAFSNDGTKMYVVGNFADDIYEYNLSTPFDVSTGVYNDNLEQTQDSKITGMTFNNDGTKMYISGKDTSAIYEYNLSTAFDVSIGIYVDNFSVSTQGTAPKGVAFNNDGTKMYVVDSGNDSVNEYNLSTPFDVSTGVYNDNLNISAHNMAASDLVFNNDGTKLYIPDSYNEDITEYNLSTPFDVSTGVYNDNLSILAQDGGASGMAFNNDGTKLYMIGQENDYIYEYDVGSVVSGTSAVSGNLTILPDTTAPTFDEALTTQTVTYGTAFGYDINASDNAAVDTYSVNDTTNFAINGSGYLSNNTLLSIGSYVLNISVNDTSGNTNSSLMTVTVSEESTATTGDTGSTGGSGCTYNSNYDWECGSWSSCVNETEVRVCKRWNNCRSIYGRPDDERNCAVGEIELFDISFYSVNNGSLEVGQGDVKTFSFNGKTSHKITVLTLMNNSVTLLITSDPISIQINVGETKQIDINQDGIDDFEITLDFIVGGEASFSLVKLEGAEIVGEEELDEAIRKEALFDVKVDIVNLFEVVKSGRVVIAKVDVMNVNNIGQVDVLVEYYLTRKGDNESRLVEGSDSLAVEAVASFVRELRVPYDVKSGEYLFNVDVYYKGEFLASGSSEFRVVKTYEIGIGIVVFLLLIGGVVFYLWRIDQREKRLEKMVKGLRRGKKNAKK